MATTKKTNPIRRELLCIATEAADKCHMSTKDYLEYYGISPHVVYRHDPNCSLPLLSTSIKLCEVAGVKFSDVLRKLGY